MKFKFFITAILLCGFSQGALAADYTYANNCTGNTNYQNFTCYQSTTYIGTTVNWFPNGTQGVGTIAKACTESTYVYQSMNKTLANSSCSFQ